MTDHFFSHGILQKKDPRPIKCSMEPGQCLCAVYHRLTWVTLCFRVKWDAKTRLQSPSESHVLQTAVCVLLPSSPGLPHLCWWPSGAVQLCMCRAVGWIKEKWRVTLVCKKKVSEVQDIQLNRMREAPHCQMMVLWRAFGAILTLFCVVTYSIITTECCRTSKWGFVVGVWTHLWPRIKTGAFFVVVIDFIMSYLAKRVVLQPW